MTAEEKRLEEARSQKSHWRRWGPYLSERHWGTVREDYSPHGTAWEYFTHDQARSRAYRWGEDGLGGICDNHQRLCFAVALWNGRDPILKERAFGLSGKEGNHGEDVKEYYFYLDNVPSHAYMKYLYKYPQQAYPYNQLVQENGRRGQKDFEFELLDTGAFDEGRYFDVFVEYAKVSAEDILIKITNINRGPEKAGLHLLPTLWFRNTWSWEADAARPSLAFISAAEGISVLEAFHPQLGRRWLYCEGPMEVLFVENETNSQRLFGVPNTNAYRKDGIHDYIIHGRQASVNPQKTGTKAMAHYPLSIEPDQSQTVRLRLSDAANLREPFGEQFEATFTRRKAEADAFYDHICPFPLTEDLRRVQRQAFAGLLWNKQYYHYVVYDWLNGDAAGPPPPAERQSGRNGKWRHIHSEDILSVPDKWEYPWFAAWDLAFHTIPLAMIDPDFAKQQLLRLTREWYMHPNGQLPAYEWAFGDVNPPVHAWAAWRVYKIEEKMYGRKDKIFLERVFQKLLLNFTWWVNRKDMKGNNVFEGGFLGLDNIGIFDRSAPLPTGGYLEQADGTSWMGMFCLNMLAIALELAGQNPSYEDIACKFLEHFIYIAAAINGLGTAAQGLWNEADGLYFDVIHLPDGECAALKIHSLVGLIPLFAVDTVDAAILEALPEFKRRFGWFIRNRPDLIKDSADMKKQGIGDRRLLSIVDMHKLRCILGNMLDEKKFLGPYGIRSMSKLHADHPYVFDAGGRHFSLDYEPAESTTGLFGGNSNWRGPIWFPINFLLIETLQKFHYYLGDSFKVECPVGSGRQMTLWEVSTELSNRLIRIFLKNDSGRRPFHGGLERIHNDLHWRDLILFNEYFHGDNGAGLGASHQTGWTGLVAKLIQQFGEYRLQQKAPVLIEREYVGDFR
jgi:Mannosylglycerate hydrolase MGH1-like glycoside hydrolase domain